MYCPGENTKCCVRPDDPRLPDDPNGSLLRLLDSARPEGGEEEEGEEEVAMGGEGGGLGVEGGSGGLGLGFEGFV